MKKGGGKNIFERHEVSYALGVRGFVTKVCVCRFEKKNWLKDALAVPCWFVA